MVSPIVGDLPRSSPLREYLLLVVVELEGVLRVEALVDDGGADLDRPTRHAPAPLIYDITHLLGDFPKTWC